MGVLSIGKILRMVAALALLAGVQAGWAVEKSVRGGYTVWRWTTGDGLPKNKVESLLQTANGYLWVGTGGGLARFDGVRFTVIGQEASRPSVPPGVPALAEDRKDGSLWIGTTDGLFRLRGGQLTRFTETNGLPHRKVWKLLAKPEGGLWIETEAGTCELTGGQFRRKGPERSLFWAETRAGDFVAGGENWIQRYDSRAGQFVDLATAELPVTLGFRAICFGRSGEVWHSTDTGLYCGREGEWRRVGSEEGLPEGVFQIIHEDSNGQIWAAPKSGGLYRRQKGQRGQPARFERMELDLSEDTVVDRIHEDREGNLWLATSEGLLRVRCHPIRTLTVTDGLLDNRISTAYAAPDDTVWIGSSTGLNWVRSNGEVGSFRYPFPRPQNNVRGLCVDPSGVLWVGAFGLYRFVNGVLEDPAHLVNIGVQSIYSDRAGTLWAGTTEGVLRQAGGERRWFTTQDGLGSNGGDVFLEDRSGHFWIGNAAGLHRVAGDRMERWSEAEGLAGGGVHAMLEDSEGQLWLGNKRGLSLFRNGRFFHFQSAHGLPEPTVHQILEDEEGFLWLSGLIGLHRVARQELMRLADGGAESARFVTFDEEDGMVMSETNGGIAPAGCRTKDGRLWFPTIRGLALVEPAKIRLSEVPPPVIIEQLKADGAMVHGGECALVEAPATGVATDQGSLGPGESARVRLAGGRGRVLEIHYTANILTASQKARFKYRLAPRDHEWTDAGSRRFALYTDLQPGEYRFEVLACNHHGIWNETGAALAFAIAPRFTQTNGFFFLAGGSVFAVAAGLHRFRIKNERRVRTLEQQLALERDRARIARDIHDDVGGGLTRIQLLGEVVDQEIGKPAERAGAQAHAREIVRTARDVVQRMDEIVWAVNPSEDKLASLIDYLCHAAQETLAPAGIRCRLDMPARFDPRPIPSEWRHDTYLLAKEAVHNVVKHSRAKQAVIRLRQCHRQLEISVQDDGQGFDPERVSSGNGLRNMRERVRRANGCLRLENVSTGGTKVTFQLPWP